MQRGPAGASPSDFEHPAGADDGSINADDATLAVSFKQKCLLTGCVFLSFVLYATVRAPVPATNEPHYLSKARHMADPAWCARDIFLQSTNAHAVYLAAFGQLTRVLTFEQTAWVGRIVVWLCLAWGWIQLATALVPGRWSPLWTAWGYLGLIAIGSLSGEWIIGGVESKGFAYAFVFLALGWACRRKSIRAALYSGLAICLHPVVGGWALIAGVGSILALFAAERFLKIPVADGISGEGKCWVRPAWKVWGVPLAIAILAALPGLVPVLTMLAESPSRDVTRHADKIVVLLRLKHHLDPLTFHERAFIQYGIMLAVWSLLVLVSRLTRKQTFAERFFHWFICGSLVIAVVGLVIGFGPRMIGLLKFYPFRLFDAMLPIALSISVVATGSWLSKRLRRSWISGLIAATAFIGFGCALNYPPADRNPSGWNAAHRRDWLEVCDWINKHTAADSLFLTPRYNFAFKWYAQRAEYGVQKDCPQDPQSLVEWQRRLDLIQNWRKSLFPNAYSAKDIAELQRETGIDFILAWTDKAVDPFQLEPIYRNESFSVYAVKPPALEKTTPTGFNQSRGP